MGLLNFLLSVTRPLPQLILTAIWPKFWVGHQGLINFLHAPPDATVMRRPLFSESPFSPAFQMVPVEILLIWNYDKCWNHIFPTTTEPSQGRFLTSHIDLRWISEQTDKNDFSKTQSMPLILQKLLFSCWFKDEHGKREKVSEQLQILFSFKISLIDPHFGPYNLKYLVESLQHISFLLVLINSNIWGLRTEL